MQKIIILLTVLALTGCASAPKPVEFPVSPKMATAFAGGEMTIAWKGAPGQTYTVYYTDVPHGTRPDWKPLPQAKELRGEGKQITVSDKVGSENQRRYMLLSGDQKLP